MGRLDIYVTHSNKIDYKRRLYTPLLESKIGKENNLILPHSKEYENVDTKNILINCDLLVAEITVPGTGIGIEIGRAESNNVSIVCLLKKGEKQNNSVRRMGIRVLEYLDEKDMIFKLNKYIREEL